MLAAVAVLGLLFAGCGSDEPATNNEAGSTPSAPAEAEDGTVVVTATEYEFDLPDALPAGPTTFSLTNAGAEEHFIEIVPLTDDAPSVEELIELPEKKVEEFFAGPPSDLPVVKPGETGTKTIEIDIQPGARYGYVCFIEAKDGTPHAFLGMVGEFVGQ
jgi:hypothetical protein